MDRQASQTANLCQKVGGLLCIELRDESIGRAIVDRMCRQSANLTEVHIAVGAYHVEGIRSRLKAVFGDMKHILEEKNMVQDVGKSAPKNQSVTN